MICSSYHYSEYGIFLSLKKTFTERRFVNNEIISCTVGQDYLLILWLLTFPWPSLQLSRCIVGMVVQVTGPDSTHIGLSTIYQIG